MRAAPFLPSPRHSSCVRTRKGAEQIVDDTKEGDGKSNEPHKQAWGWTGWGVRQVCGAMQREAAGQGRGREMVTSQAAICVAGVQGRAKGKMAGYGRCGCCLPTGKREITLQGVGL